MAQGTRGAAARHLVDLASPGLIEEQRRRALEAPTVAMRRDDLTTVPLDVVPAQPAPATATAPSDAFFLALGIATLLATVPWALAFGGALGWW
ncbi:hypothetical protein [Actinomycetospora aeridis]|uniref:Uncharacterized protein n=1 Tax=Actinomycetospora aeridis TaxID=3129231 RepID=A0ABU8N1C0_9PSEU